MFLVQEKIKNSRREKCRSYSRLASSVQFDSAIKKSLLYTVLSGVTTDIHYAILFRDGMEQADVMSHLVY